MFAYVSQDNQMKINSLRQVAPEQLVCIKGTIVQLSSSKTVVLQSSPVKKQEGYIADPTGYIKVILWVAMLIPLTKVRLTHLTS